MAEQDWSLNPGRYVGVVIEEDGKTEEEFISGILGLSDQLSELTRSANELERVVTANISTLADE